jgi:transcription termination/antitermination protein NusG
MSVVPAVRQGLNGIGAGAGRWWVLHTRARNEKCVAAKLAERRIDYFLPLVSVRRTYAKSKATFELPLFPGYVFLRGDEGACDIARRTNRVAHILHVDNQTQLHTELQQVQAALASGEPVALYPALQTGQRCRMSGGPLKGLEGVVIQQGRQCRMWLEVTVLGQSAVVEVDAAMLEVVA